MSIYKRSNSSAYWCEFWVEGNRFRLSTGETEQRQAKLAEKRLKAQKQREIEQDKAKRAAWNGKAPPEMGVLVARYWQEVGQFHAAAKTTWWSLEWLVDYFGETTLLTDITSERIAEMVARRRAIRVRRDPETKALIEIPAEGVQNATVNRYAVEPLRKLFRRARDVWGYQVPYPDWGRLLLSEPQERIREAVGDEEKQILEALGLDYGRLFRFMMSTGTRVSGALLTWPQVDRANRVIRVRNKGKDGQQRWYMVPLTAAQLAILDECAGHHETHVFTYEEVRPGKDAEGRRLEPKRFPITDNGFKAHWRRRVREAGVAPGFRRHDTRHTAGTRLVRTTGNLKVAQRLLGHSRIETTTRYAHVMIEDVRAAMEAVENAHTAPNTHISAPTPDEKAKKKSG